MIVGLCGTHGTGKSTLLQAAKDIGFKVDESQLSRTAQKSLGWDKLSIAEESSEKMWQLQDAILAAMYDRDKKIIESKQLTIVERTPADVWAYTAMWCRRHNVDAEKTTSDLRVLTYKGLCRNLASYYTKFIVVPSTEQIPFVKEPNRADEESREFVEREINAFLWDGLLPFYVIKNIERFTRKAEIQAILTILSAEQKAKGM